MTNQRSNSTARRWLTRALGIGTIAGGVLVGLAPPAHAAGIDGYHAVGSSGVRVVTDPTAASPTTLATLADGTAITVDCGVHVRRRHGGTVWHHITAPVTGYIADYDTDTPGYNRLIRGEATCAPTTAPAVPAAPVAPTTTPAVPASPAAPTTTPATPAAPTTTPAVRRGATINYNQGYGGSCIYYALDRFHQETGVYPKAFGDAKYIASGANASGWTVSTTPRVKSMAIFQPGQNGAAAPTGHAAWVEQVSGGKIYIAEMNAPKAWVVTYRWITPAAGVQYVYS